MKELSAIVSIIVAVLFIAWCEWWAALPIGIIVILWTLYIADIIKMKNRSK